MSRWRRPALVAALLALACVEPTGPGEERFGQVRLRPVFSAGESEAALRVTVDSIVVVITRAGRALPVVESRTAFRRDETLGWVLEMEVDEESLPTRVELRGGGALLYEGEATLHAQVGRVANVEVRDVMVAYVGEPRAMSVAVTPEAIILDALGASGPLVATAFDAAGAPLPGKEFHWTSSAPLVATVDADGTVTARADGEAEISATVDSLVAVAQVRVAVRAAPGTSTIDAEPATVRADGIEAAVIRVRLLDANGNAFTSSGGVVALTTTLGTLSPVTDGGDGTYRATLVSTAVGIARVEGTLDGEPLDDNATVQFTAVPTVTPVVASIVVSPSASILTALGATQQFTAEAREADGTPIPGVTFAWTSGATAVATVDPASGVVTAVGEGATLVSATAGGVSGTATLQVSLVVAPGRSTLEVTPASLPADGITTATLLVRLLDANGNALGRSGGEVELATTLGGISPVIDRGDGTYTATIASAVVGVASVSGTIDGEPLGNDVTVEFTVGPPVSPVIASIVVTPFAATLTALGATQQFTAEAREADGTPIPGVVFAWTSGNTAVATVDPATGLATAVSEGETAITASAEGIDGTATLTVAQEAAPTSSIVTADPGTLPADGVASALITVRLLDAHGNPLASSGGVVALTTTLGTLSPVTDVGDGSYRATLVSATAGSARVEGTLDGEPLGNDVTVEFTEVPPEPPVVASISVTPATTALTALGATRQFTAEAREADGTLIPGVTFAWTSGATTVATVDPATGLATAVGEGAAAITASAAGVSGTATLQVSPVVEPGRSTLEAAPTSVPADGLTTATLLVRLLDANGNALGRSGGEVELATTLGGISPVTDRGDGTYTATIASAVVGLASVSGTIDGEPLGNDVTVEFTEVPPEPPVIASISVTPAATTLTALGATRQFTAEAREADGTPIPGVVFTWTALTPAVASIDASIGLATAHANGATDILASAGGVSGTAALVVEQRAAAVIVSPDATSLGALGATVQLSALVVDAGGAPVPDQGVTWSSAAEEIATVGATGEIVAVANGSTTVRAAATADPTLIGTSAVTVAQRAASITLAKACPAAAPALRDPDSGGATGSVPISCDTLSAIGDQVQVTATVRDSLGSVILAPVIAWTSSAASVATVDEAGLVTARGNGSAGIAATVDGVTAEVEVVVRQSVVSITIVPETLTLEGVGAEGTLVATARDRNGHAVEDAAIDWGVLANPEVAAVSQTGVVTALSAGTAVIKVRSGDARAEATVIVR